MPRPPRISKREVFRLVKLWRQRLHLTDWEIGIEVRKLEDDEGKAHCAAMPEYRQATLRFDPDSVTPADLEATVIHELLHCWCWGLATVAETLAAGNRKHLEWSRIEEERLVTGLERIVRELSGPG